MRGRQWISLELSVEDKWLYFNIGNSKPVKKPVSQDRKEGIGLSNVQTRLRLLYPEKHQLTIESTDAAFFVHLKIELEEKLKTPAYA